MRKLKAVGLSLIAVFAMSALAASAASASEFHSEVEPTTIKGTQLGTDVFTTDAGTVKCTEANYLGTQATKTSKEIEVEPTYTGCTAFGFAGAVIEPNGCKYRFTEPTAAGASFTGKVDIVCPTGKSITVVASLGGTVKCTVHVPSQNGLGTITYHNNALLGAERDVTVTVSITETIKYSTTAGTGLGACKSGENTENGSYTGEATVKGFEGAIQKGVWVA